MGFNGGAEIQRISAARTFRRSTSIQQTNELSHLVSSSHVASVSFINSIESQLIFITTRTHDVFFFCYFSGGRHLVTYRVIFQ